MSMMIRRHKQRVDKGETEKVLPKTSVAEDKPNYTKTDIMRMSKIDLVRLASKIGVYDAENSNGNALKDRIIKKLGL